jgi:pyruvate/2-oxoglutarate dehydrogenase complex dihydrolipoamide dehydrogenase (E3) component
MEGNIYSFHTVKRHNLLTSFIVIPEDNILQKKIVIIGYGIAGSYVTGFFSKIPNCKVTVVSPLDYQEVPLRMSKVLSVGGKEHSSAIYDLIKEEGVDYARGTCVSVKNSLVMVSNGTSLEFDACVVCVGQNVPVFYPDPTVEQTKTARMDSIAAVHFSIRTAQSIVIGGGGPIGVEIASDIKLRFPDKR